LALDISGAALLAKGLLLPPGMIAVLSGSYDGYNPSGVVNRAHDRIDAEFAWARCGSGSRCKPSHTWSHYSAWTARTTRGRP
jgi:hypothetical protein